MKSREEFISDIFDKAEAFRAKEAKEALLRKKRRKIAGAVAAAAACVMIAVGVGTLGEGGLLDKIITGSFETAGQFAAEPVTNVPYDANANDDNAGTAVNDEASDGDTSAAENDDANGGGDATESGGKSGSIGEDSDAPATYEFSDGDWGIAPNKSVRQNSVYDSYIYGSEKMQDISIEIFKQAASSKKNSMISPFSGIMAMGMVENGAAGDTKSQMEKVFGMGTEDMNEWIKAWSAAQESKSTDGKAKLNIANAFWYNETAGFKPDSGYKKLLKKPFDADIKGGNFDNSTVNQNNNWVDE